MKHSETYYKWEERICLTLAGIMFIIAFILGV